MVSKKLFYLLMKSWLNNNHGAYSRYSTEQYSCAYNSFFYQQDTFVFKDCCELHTCAAAHFASVGLAAWFHA